ncbi:MAG: hypothetical protein HZA17_04400 [Nitrospirae bacterium]|nr:hypothetical protein [Nitrospirota bacterium]
MKPREVLNKKFSVSLIASIVLIIVAGVLLSAAYFYFHIDGVLGETYNEKLVVLSQYKFEIIRQSLYIFLGFFLVAIFCVACFGILHTHKIVGPLVRIRTVARELANKNFNVYIKFREGDAIHPMAESLDYFAKVYGKKYGDIGSGINELYNDACELRDLIKKGDAEGAAAKRARIAARTGELNRILSEIKV